MLMLLPLVAAQYVKLPITGPQLHKRSTSVDLKNHINLFSTQLEIGSNRQKVNIVIDTGSSDLWVMDVGNPLCEAISDTDSTQARAGNGGISCQQSAMFDSSKSSSFSENNTKFDIYYQDYTFASGTYAQDTISYGGVTISNANFAVGTKTNISRGVWGIGLPGAESTVTHQNNDGTVGPKYSNLPMQMKEQGLIQHVAYSLWLNSLSSSDGELLFGAVDHSKYSGQLQTLPILKSYQNVEPIRLQILLSAVSIYQDQQTTQIASCALPAILDSGSTMMVLPASIYNAIVQSSGLEVARQGVLGSCGLSGGLTFDFSGAQINVPFSELAIPLGQENTCLYGIQATSSYEVVLGDTFLRSAYVVYDLENFEISLANANFNIGDGNIEEISGSVPSAARASGYSNTQTNNEISTQIASNFQTGLITATINSNYLAETGGIDSFSTVSSTSTVSSISTVSSGATGTSSSTISSNTGVSTSDSISSISSSSIGTSTKNGGISTSSIQSTIARNTNSASHSHSSSIRSITLSSSSLPSSTHGITSITPTSTPTTQTSSTKKNSANSLEPLFGMLCLAMLI